MRGKIQDIGGGILAGTLWVLLVFLLPSMFITGFYLLLVFIGGEL